jgi:hypothetical protein
VSLESLGQLDLQSWACLLLCPCGNGIFVAPFVVFGLCFVIGAVDGFKKRARRGQPYLRSQVGELSGFHRFGSSDPNEASCLEIFFELQTLYNNC